MRNRRGVTLIELLVTVVISLLLVGAVTFAFTSFGRNALVENSVTEVQMDLHSALALMTDELRQARYIYNTEALSPEAAPVDPAAPPAERLRLDPLNPPLEPNLEQLSSAVFDKSQFVQASSPGFRILLAFWVPSIAGTARLDGASASAPEGTPLAFSIANGSLVPWGSPSAIPAYNLIVYYVTDPPPGSAWTGPRILERWESKPVPIRFDEFAEAEDPQQFLSPESIDTGPIPPVDGIFLRNLPASDSNSFALADGLEREEGIEVHYLSPQTVQISLRGSLVGSQADRYLSGDSGATTYLRTRVGDALGYTTTVVARNVCSKNAVCVKDP